jgi:hypothetical protein
MASSNRQARISKGRRLRLSTAAIAAEPSDGYSGSFLSGNPLTTPHHIMSPRTATRMMTTGIVIGLDAGIVQAPAAVPTSGGFRLVLWIANPTGYRWYRTTAVFMSDRDASVTYDINAFPLYIQIDATSVSVNGNIDFEFMEM